MSNIDDYGRSRLYNILNSRHKSSYTIRQYLQVYDLKYGCIIELTERQNNILKSIVNDELLNEAKSNTRLSKHVYETIYTDSDSCVILFIRKIEYYILYRHRCLL